MLVLGGLVIAFSRWKKFPVAAACQFDRRIPDSHDPRARSLPYDPFSRQPLLQISAWHCRLIGGMWIINLAYWGFNQNTSSARSPREASAKCRWASFWPPF